MMWPRKKLISINNGYILVSLFDWSLSPPKRWHYISQAITPSQTSSPVSPPPGQSISGWLLCVSSSIGGHLRPRCDSFYIIFLLSLSSPKQWDDVSPHAPTPARPLSNIPPTAIIDFWLVVVCFYLVLAIRQTPFPSLWFLRGICTAPRTGEPTALSANLALDALLGYFGSLSAMCWWHHWSTHGGRGQSRWRVGWRYLMLVVVCFVLLCFVLDRTFV